jgi:invasion protein IalB
MMIALTALLSAAPAMAQAPRAQPAPPAAEQQPDRTSASFADWTLRCEVLRPATGPAQRSCEVVQTYSDQRGQPVAVLAIGRPARGEPMRMILQIPLDARIDQPARLSADPAQAQDAVVLPFRFCSAVRGGCFAELELRDDAPLRRLRARGEQPGRVEYRDSAGREVQLPFSPRGLGQALDALAREPG